MKPITRHCDECRYFIINYKNYINTFDNVVSCEKEHKLRYYPIRSPVDNTYGWKRKCFDFKPIENSNE